MARIWYLSNHDSYMDAIVGSANAQFAFSNEGAFFLHYGSASGLQNSSAFIYGGSINATFGKTLAVGTIDSDSYDDIVVGCELCSNPESQEGAVFIYYGNSPFNLGQIPTRLELNTANQLVGRLVATADLDHNGFDDIIAATQTQTVVWYSNGNYVYSPIFLAISNPLSIAGGMDLNADGIEDLLISDPTNIYVIYGKMIGSLAPIQISLTVSPFRYLNFIGDVDHDGGADFAVIDPPNLVIYTQFKPSAAPSPTPTRSVTPSPSSSPSITPTPTATPSNSPSAFVSPSSSPKVSATPTSTPSASITSSVTPSASITPSVTPSIEPNESSSIDTVAVAAGTAGGGSGCLIIVVVAGVFWCRKKKNKDDTDTSSLSMQDAEIELSS